MRTLVIAVLLASVAAWAAQPAPVDFSGAWKVDRDASTGQPTWKEDRVVISQTGQEIRMHFLDARGEDLGTVTVTTDNREQPLYKTRIARAYGRARLINNELSITTRTFLDAEGSQSYTETDRWVLSKDGNTLTNKLSSGKKIVYYKQKPK